MHRNEPPYAAHWLGTTHIGEDVLSQIINGTRGVIVVGFLAAIIATVIAIVIGVIAGLLSRRRSEALSALDQRLPRDPGLPLIIIVASMFEDPPLLIAAVLALIGWAWGARVLRAQTMSLRNRDFVQAARANGEPLRRIIAVEMLPNLMAVIASSFVGTVTAAILGPDDAGLHRHHPDHQLQLGHILFWAQSSTRSPTSGGGTCPPACASRSSAWRSRSSTSASTSTSTRACVAPGERARAMRKKGFTLSDGATAVAQPDRSPARLAHPPPPRSPENHAFQPHPAPEFPVRCSDRGLPDRGRQPHRRPHRLGLGHLLPRARRGHQR